LFALPADNVELLFALRAELKSILWPTLWAYTVIVLIGFFVCWVLGLVALPPDECVDYFKLLALLFALLKYSLIAWLSLLLVGPLTFEPVKPTFLFLVLLWVVEVGGFSSMVSNCELYWGFTPFFLVT
jgi:hypothetical protein